MSNIPVNKVERTASHPAWLPVNVDGSVITGATIGDAQAFGIGTADKAVGGNTFKGDSGQMITLDGYNFTKTNEDHTGDGDDAVQMRGVNPPGARPSGNSRAWSRQGGHGFRRCCTPWRTMRLSAR